MVSGRSDDAMEDPEYVKVRDYVASLEGHVGEVHRQVGLTV
jgi:sorting nexin-1/2